jgi:hypothetical protein
VNTVEALFMPIAVIVAAYLLGRSAEKVARTLLLERRPERGVEQRREAYAGRASGLRKMTAIAFRQGWDETELDRHIKKRLGK